MHLASNGERYTEHDEMLQWCGGSLDLYAFDIELVNAQLKRIKI